MGKQRTFQQAGANVIAVSGDSVSLAPSAAQTAGGSGSSFATDDSAVLRLTLNVSAVSGTTPSMTVTVEHSADGTSWSAHSAFTAVTAVGQQRKVFAGVDRFVRVSWAITGTSPSFTFSVNGEAV